MAKMVIEIPEELRGLGEAMAATLASVQGTLARTGGGKAVDYERVEVAISKESGKIECEGTPPESCVRRSLRRSAEGRASHGAHLSPAEVLG